MAGRERQWPLTIDGKTYWVYEKDGAPQWQTQLVPEVAGDQIRLAEEERPWTSWHAGFGWSHDAAEHTYHYALGIDARAPRQLIMGPLVTTLSTGASGNVTCFAEAGGALYVVAGRYCHKIDSADDHCETPNDGANGKDFGAGVAATSATAFDSGLVVWLGNAADAWGFDGNATWAQLTTNHIKGAYGANFWASTFYALARSHTDSSDPCVAWLAQGNALDSTDWSANYDVGDDTAAVTALCAKERTVWVSKTDGLYYVDATGRTPRVFDVPLASTNGQNSYLDQEGWLWYPSTSGLIRYNTLSGEVWDCSPARGQPNHSPIYGRPLCGRQHRGWHYWWFYNGTTSYLLAGRLRQQGEPGYGPMIWHGALVAVTGQVTNCHITYTTNPPRLYWGVGQAVQYIRLPANADNPLQDANYRYAASGSIYLPETAMGVAGTRWVPLQWVIDTERCTATTAVTIYAQLDGGGWQKVGTATVSPRHVLPVPTGDWRHSRGALRLDFVNAASTSTPIVRSLVQRAARRVETRPLVTTALILSDKLLSHYGIQTRRSGQEMFKELERLSVAGAVTLTDNWPGYARSRQALVFTPRSQIVKATGVSNGQKWEEATEICELTLAVLESETTQAQAQQTAGIWDSSLWDSFVWG